MIYNRTSKASTKNYSAAAESAQDRALDKFAQMMIEKIESINQDWSKPWFTEGSMQWPRNLSGRFYNGMNSLMLLMQCEKMGYKIPVFCTFDRVAAMNFTKSKDGVKPAADKDGNKLPLVSVNKGEKSFPVFLTVFTVVDPETGEKIKYDDYKLLSEDSRSKYNVYPKLQVYNVFNVAQTNLAEARPEIYASLTKSCVVEKPVDKVNMSFEPVDKMITENLWICPIQPKHGDDCYYSISRDLIVVPEKSQFKTGESFYSNLFHECAHSTGAEKHLNRLKPTSFGSAEYAKEELVAELTAALVAQYYGLDKHLKEDSAAYLKSWLHSLKEDASFIKTVLLDVKRASAMLTKVIDEVKNTVNKEVA